MRHSLSSSELMEQLLRLCSGRGPSQGEGAGARSPYLAAGQVKSCVLVDIQHSYIGFRLVQQELCNEEGEAAVGQAWVRGPRARRRQREAGPHAGDPSTYPLLQCARSQKPA